MQYMMLLALHRIFYRKTSLKRRAPNKRWGLLAMQSVRAPSVHVIATPTLCVDTDNSLFL